MLKANLTMNQNASELKVLRRQVNQLKMLIENKNIEIKKLREELADVKQDRSNMLLSWAELDHYYSRDTYKNITNEDEDDSKDI
jgi:hypothetical protein